MLAFSSVSAHMGGALLGAYAAANSLLEGVCTYLKQQTEILAYCYSWTSWRGLGMSATMDYSEILAQKGFYTISTQNGLISMNTLMERDICECLIGLDESKFAIRRQINRPNVEKIAKCVVAPIGINAKVSDQLHVQDQFGTSFYVDVKRLEKLPRTPNGEIDKLGIERLIRGRKRSVPPQSATEKGLFSIWSEVLNHTDFGIKDNFFELGGNSLIALQMFTQINKHMDIDLPLATLFDTPTISQLSERIDSILYETRIPNHPRSTIENPSSINAQEWSPLVTIQTGNGRHPFFCVHCGGGNVLIFQDLVDRLGPEQTFFGLQARGVDGRLAPLESIEEMADLYLSYIRQVQPKGPYRLGGYSGGGLVVHKIAHMLRQEGEVVSLLVLLDTRYPGYVERRLNVTEHLSLMNHQGVLPYVQLRMQARLKKMKYAFRLSKNHSSYQKNKDRDVVPLEIREQVILKAFRRAGEKYRPNYYPANIYLFRATDISITESHIPYELGWKDKSDDLEIIEVPGNHFSFIVDPHVDVLAQNLRQLLRGD
jgi:thioesterase domain-containing protein/acyl carrier protein